MIRVGAFFRLIRDSDSNRTNFEGYRRFHFFGGRNILKKYGGTLTACPLNGCYNDEERRYL